MGRRRRTRRRPAGGCASPVPAAGFRSSACLRPKTITVLRRQGFGGNRLWCRSVDARDSPWPAVISERIGQLSRIALAAVAATVLFSASAGADDRNFTVVNGTGYDIKGLFINPPGDNDFNDNELSGTLGDGNKFDVKFSGADKGCTWNMKVTWTDNSCRSSVASTSARSATSRSSTTRRRTRRPTPGTDLRSDLVRPSLGGPDESSPEHAGEDRLDVLGVVADVEQALELLKPERVDHRLLPLQAI